MRTTCKILDSFLKTAVSLAACMTVLSTVSAQTSLSYIKVAASWWPGDGTKQVVGVVDEPNLYARVAGLKADSYVITSLSEYDFDDVRWYIYVCEPSPTARRMVALFDMDWGAFAAREVYYTGTGLRLSALALSMY